MRVKQPPIFYLPFKGSTGKVGLSGKMFPSSSAVKSTRKARGFAPFGPQLQFQAIGQVRRRSRTVIHCLLHVLKHGRFITYYDHRGLQGSCEEFPGGGAGDVRKFPKRSPLRHKGNGEATFPTTLPHRLPKIKAVSTYAESTQDRL